MLNKMPEEVIKIVKPNGTPRTQTGQLTLEEMHKLTQTNNQTYLTNTV